MDTQNLQAFLMVAELGSFSRAAEALYLTQPAVSKRVAALESQLECSLFDRIGRRVFLTEAGRALLPFANSIRSSLTQARQSIRDLSGEVGGTLLLGTSHHIGLHRLPPVLRRFSSTYGGVKLDIDFMDSEQAYEQISRGNIELALVTLAPEADPTMLATPVWSDPLDFMVAQDHELGQAKTITLEMLSAYPVILPGLNTYTGQIAKRLFDERGLKLNIAMSTNYLETIGMMASIGLGWTVLPRSMLSEGLQALTIKGISPQRELGYIYHRGRTLSNAAQAFIQELY
ncbi:LysR family transcriptional regulator [Halieaceae bacterium IMCC14734]|uniref:LysR family transcriptional regulator n=1 Tax=Candidatus Litorirhabdus singularis TaxID=2518993 RepID=A0ABT3THC6_9GAMM|nr:LysR family transcriptional regulator [Candidatus Litorirhabdus singularis]MCX2981681.1 LysR family transcriptional regulator [Candidatus Litorirhabdus singularis]